MESGLLELECSVVETTVLCVCCDWSAKKTPMQDSAPLLKAVPVPTGEPLAPKTSPRRSYSP